MGHPLENIIAWLEAGATADYQAGVLLLQEHGSNRSLVNLLLRKESASHREKLRYELVKVVAGGRLSEVAEVLNHFASHFAQDVQSAVPSPVIAQETAPMPGFASKVAPLAEQPAPDAVPEAVRGEVDAITELMQGLYNQRCQLSNSLADLPEGDCPCVVGDILSLQNQYNALAEKRRRLIAGEAVAPAQPAVEAAPVLDRAQLAKDRQNLRSNISKAKGKLAKATSETKKTELEQKIAQLGVELAHLDMQLALPQA